MNGCALPFRNEKFRAADNLKRTAIFLAIIQNPVEIALASTLIYNTETMTVNEMMDLPVRYRLLSCLLIYNADEGESMSRLFVALDISQDVKEELTRFCCGLPGARWVPGDQFHLTLHFIGEVDGAVFRDVRDLLADVRGNALETRLAGVGLFPPRKIPKVLWVGVDTNEQLEMLRNRIGSLLMRAGVEVEKRKFMPHITLARLRNTPMGRLARFLAAHNLYASRTMIIKNFKLYSSIVSSKGAVHTVEGVYPLGDQAGADMV
jgi:2'-5' RNA ligase